jgi:hypothetical protein
MKRIFAILVKLFIVGIFVLSYSVVAASADAVLTDASFKTSGHQKESVWPIKSSCAISGGVCIPAGDFGDANSNSNVKSSDAGFASLGACATLKYFADLGTTLLGFTFDASIIMNSLNKNDFEDAVRNEFSLPETYALSSSTSPWWITVPFLMGPAVHVRASSDLSFRAATLGGFAIVMPGELNVQGDNTSVTYHYESVAALCGGFEVSIGVNNILISSRVIFSQPENVDAHEDVNLFGISFQNDYEKDFKMTMFTISLGYEF